MRKILAKVKSMFKGTKAVPIWQNNPWQQKQEEFMHHCLFRPDVKISGVLHVGGHLGEEYTLYKQAGAVKVVFFEPIQEVFLELLNRLGALPDVTLLNYALGSKVETRGININVGAGESTSFLKPTAIYDGFFQPETRQLEIKTLDSVFKELPGRENYNTLVIDTQGFDLEVLKGATETLRHITYIYTEVSCGHYHNEPSLQEFDQLLLPLGFIRVETSMYGKWKENDQWGDIFYIKTC